MEETNYLTTLHFHPQELNPHNEDFFLCKSARKQKSADSSEKKIILTVETIFGTVDVQVTDYYPDIEQEYKKLRAKLKSGNVLVSLDFMTISFYRYGKTSEKLYGLTLSTLGFY